MEKEGTPYEGRSEITVPAQDQNLFAVKRCVLRYCIGLVRRNFIHRIDRVCRTSRDARATVHAIVRVNVHLCFRFPLWLIRLRVDGVAGTGIDTKLVFRASVDDYMRHECISSNSIGRLLRVLMHSHSRAL